MPKELSIKPEPYQHHWSPTAKYDQIFTGWTYPPKDYAKWGELVYQWARHCVEKYGRAEVESWYWETWNEPNIGYWRGTPEEFRKLHDYAIDGVRRALPTARVGGADSAGSGGKWTRDFLEHCLRGTNHATGKVGTPIDFVSFHAKGAPSFVDGHVRMGIANQLRTIDDGFRIVASFPELKDKPIVIGESDPDGCAACQGPQLGYRNGTMYSSYTAASFARKHDLADRHGVNLEGALTWAFEFEDQPYLRRVPRAGEQRHRPAGAERLPDVQPDGRPTARRPELGRGRARRDPQRAACAARPTSPRWPRSTATALSVLAWHYHDDDLPGPDAEVSLELARPARAPTARSCCTTTGSTAQHSNAFEAWKRMGSPQRPTPEQYAALVRAGQLERLDPPSRVRAEGGKLTHPGDIASAGGLAAAARPPGPRG